MLTAVILLSIGCVIFFGCLIKSVQNNEELKKKIEDKKKCMLIISGGSKDTTWAPREADLITDVELKKVQIEDQEFWKLSYIEDGMECEVIDPEPMRYSLRLGKK
jgi:hypothetical protein